MYVTLKWIRRTAIVALTCLCIATVGAQQPSPTTVETEVARPTSGERTTWSQDAAWVRELAGEEQTAVILDLRAQFYRSLEEITPEAKAKPGTELWMLKQAGLTDYRLAKLATEAPELRDALF